MSLRRVSSRPRLCSFEEFNASEQGKDTASDSSSDTESYETCLMDQPPSALLSPLAPLPHKIEPDTASLAPLKRKRMSRGNCKVSPIVSPSLEPSGLVTPPSDVIPHVIPPPYEQEANLSLASLPPEVQLSVLEMLDVDSLRNTMLVDREHRQLLQSSEAVEAIWKPVCEQHWHCVEGKPLVDHLHTAACGDATNHPFLLSLAASTFADDVDETLFSGTRWTNRLRGRARRPHHFRTELVKKKTKGASSASAPAVVQFTGTVGVGDRCVRANAPLPRPAPLRTAASSPGKNLLNRFARKHPVLCHYDVEQHAVWKPFVAPFCVGKQQQQGNNNNNNAMDLTPRLVSYFEISLLEADGPAEPARPRPFAAALRPVASECIAVGLATEDFHVQTRMPGWDRESFGFHGDDGGIFHNSGSMLSQFSSHFGVGDTIGCGVDYQRQAIFYTRNGEFLGYAFSLQDSYLNRDLYPVVGIDAHCLVSCNFGVEKPFMFDLQGMIAKHKDVVLRAIEKARAINR